MDINKKFGWFFLVYSGWSLLFGIIANDMGGLASLGYNPDVAMSFGRAPFRFLIGIIINGVLIYYGWQLITGKKTLRR
jgi:hypothetical protein